MNTHLRVQRCVVLVAAVVFLCPPAFHGATAKPAAHAPATLRVGLWTLWHDKELTVSPAPEGGASMREYDGCSASAISQPIQIRAVGANLAFKGNRQAVSLHLWGPVTLAAHGESLTLRNPVSIKARNGELVLAVILPVESYVERVVASESGADDGAESLKALAIVVRSFALHQPHNHADYDLCDSTHCQLLHWSGNAGRHSAAHAATLATAGETLWYHGQRAEAWFHQNCGGRTASPSEVWPRKRLGNKPMSWLASRTDNYCTAGGAREWAADLSLAELTTALAAQGLARPGWKSLTVAKRGDSGRAVTLLVDSQEISAEDFRLAVGRTLGWNKILSNWFEVSRQGERFLFHGRGSGHGVGLCQAGAAAMGAGGHDATEILAQYFSGAAASDEGTGLNWQSFHGQGFVLESLDPADGAYLSKLSQALAEAETRSSLHPAETITLRAFRSTPAFRDGTQAPGWVAAFTEGNWIGTQPLRTLAARRLLISALRHEFLHALVESQSTASTPLWLREGLVEAWSDEVTASASPPTLKLNEIDRALAHATSEPQSQAAHRAAGWYAARLLERFGRTQVIGWLHSGVPASTAAALN